MPIKFLPRFGRAVDGAASVAMLAASSVMVWVVLTRGAEREDRTPTRSPVGAPKTARLPDTPLSLEGTSKKGSLTASVGVIEFSDFECPYCVRFYRQAYPPLMKEYVDTGRVVVAFRHLPLSRIHPNAMKAAQAAECAGEQGRFWGMHDALFDAPKQLDVDSLITRARSTRLDADRFERCLSRESHGTIDAHVSEARMLGITGTPTFLMGYVTSDQRLQVVRRESGAIPEKALRKILDDLLAGRRPREF